MFQEVLLLLLFHLPWAFQKGSFCQVLLASAVYVYSILSELLSSHFCNRCHAHFEANALGQRCQFEDKYFSIPVHCPILSLSLLFWQVTWGERWREGGNETRMEVFLKVEGRSTFSPGSALLSPKLLATTFAGCFTLLQQYNDHWLWDEIPLTSFWKVTSASLSDNWKLHCSMLG